MNHPSTIRNPELFDKMRPAGFDGVFDWSWTEGCFHRKPEWKDPKPMDIDACVEVRGRLLVFETKNPGASIPHAQAATLKALESTGIATILLVYGKALPEYCKHRDASGNWATIYGVDMARGFCRAWFLWADSQPWPKFARQNQFDFCPIGADFK